MIKSMTGFGRSQQIIDGRDIAVEIKSVNHRYFDFSARVPRMYGYLEEKTKAYVQKQVARGKIDISISVFKVEGTDAQVEINKELAKDYVDRLREIKDELNLVDDLSLSAISRFSDIFTVKKQVEDEELVWSNVQTVLEDALQNFINMRELEGERMRKDVVSRLDYIKEIVDKIEVKAPLTVSSYREKLFARMKEVLQDTNIDEQRILIESAIFSEKVAVDEETVRLKSHIKQFNLILKEETGIGRKLDFLVQEMNRETNTIGSKAQNLEITNMVVEIKSEIEKIREQIQNIE